MNQHEPRRTHQLSLGCLQETLFTSGEGSYHTYRIPALAVTVRGTLLAFAEGRKHGRGDAGEIDLILRRSFDNGRTWSSNSSRSHRSRHDLRQPLPCSRASRPAPSGCPSAKIWPMVAKH